jgi:hypothetical protein
VLVEEPLRVLPRDDRVLGRAAFRLDLPPAAVLLAALRDAVPVDLAERLHRERDRAEVVLPALAAAVVAGGELVRLVPERPPLRFEAERDGVVEHLRVRAGHPVEAEVGVAVADLEHDPLRAEEVELAVER